MLLCVPYEWAGFNSWSHPVNLNTLIILSTGKGNQMNVSCPPHLVTSLRNFSIRKLNIQNPIHSFSQWENFLTLFFLSGGFSQWQVGEDVKKTYLLKFPNSSVLHDVTFSFLSPPINIISRCSINPCLAGPWGYCSPQILSPNLALPCLGPAFPSGKLRLPLPKEYGWKTREG